MAFDPDTYLASKEGSATTFDPDKYLAEKEPMTLEGFKKNIPKDVMSNLKGAADLGAYAFPPLAAMKAAQGENIYEPKKLETLGKGAITGIPEEAKRVGLGELATGHPIDAAEKFGRAMYDKPLTTAMDLEAISGLNSLRGGKAPIPETMAPIAEDISRIPRKPSVSSAAPLTTEEAIGKTTPIDPVSPEPPPDFLSGIKNKIPKEVLDPIEQVNNYLRNQYGEAAKKPGMANTAANYLEEHSRNMNLKEMGAAPGQVRKIGVERAHALADYANENGLVGPKIGTQGREKLIASRLQDAGGAVGAFRKMAEDRGAVQDIGDLTNEIKAKLDQKYLTPGMYSGQKGTYLKALDELKKTSGSASELSDKVTEMFKEAKNQNPLGKPTGPLADVAREVRAINHNAISKALSPQEMTLYEKSLEDYGALTQINEFAKRRSSTEAGGRLGPGAGISRAAVQKFLDSFGYRAEAKIAGKLADYIRKNPDILSRPKDIFRQYIDEAAEAVHEMGDATH